MQSGMADFALVAATWRTRRIIRIVHDSGPFAPLGENMTSSTKPEVYVLQLASEKDRGTGNVHRKFGEIWTCDFVNTRADRQTDRQTDRHSDRNTSHHYRRRSDLEFDWDVTQVTQSNRDGHETLKLVTVTRRL